MIGNMTASDGLMKNFLKEKKNEFRGQRWKEDKRVLHACEKVCMKCKASVAAVQGATCSPVVGEIGNTRQSQMLQGL